MENVKNIIDYQVAGDGSRSGHEGGLDIEARVPFFFCVICPVLPRISRFHRYLTALWLRVIDCNLLR